MTGATAPIAQVNVFSRDYVLSCLSFFAFYFSYYLVMPIMPLYVVRVGGSETEVGIIVGAMMISSLVVRLFIGRSVDARPKWLFLVGGAALFVVSPLLYAAVSMAPALLAVRLLHGIGIGIFVTALYSLVADIVPSKQRGEAIGYVGLGGNVAMALGPLLGISMLRGDDFNLVFLTAASLALVALVSISLVRSAYRQPSLAVAKHGSLFCREAALPSLLAMLLVFGYGGLVSFLPLYAASGNIGNPGLFFTAYALSMIATRTISGRLSDRFGRSAVIAPGFLIASFGLLALMSARQVETMVVAAMIYGIGFASAIPSLQALVADRTQEGQRGIGMSMIGMAVDLGNGLGGVVLGVALQLGGFPALFLIGSGAALLGFGLALIDLRSDRIAVGGRR